MNIFFVIIAGICISFIMRYIVDVYPTMFSRRKHMLLSSSINSQEKSNKFCIIMMEPLSNAKLSSSGTISHYRSIVRELLIKGLSVLIVEPKHEDYQRYDFLGNISCSICGDVSYFQYMIVENMTGGLASPGLFGFNQIHQTLLDYKPDGILVPDVLSTFLTTLTIPGYGASRELKIPLIAFVNTNILESAKRFDIYWYIHIQAIENMFHFFHRIVLNSVDVVIFLGKYSYHHTLSQTIFSTDAIIAPMNSLLSWQSTNQSSDNNIDSNSRKESLVPVHDYLKEKNIDINPYCTTKFLFLGRISIDKHIHEVLEASAQMFSTYNHDNQVQHNQPCLIIIGRDGGGMNYVSDYMQKFPRHIFYGSEIPHEDIAKLLYSVDALVFIGGEVDVFPYVVWESVSVNLPVLAVSNKKTTSWVQDMSDYFYEENLILVESNKEEIQAMSKLMDSFTNYHEVRVRIRNHMKSVNNINSNKASTTVPEAMADIIINFSKDYRFD